MDKAHLITGDVVEIQGTQKTVAKCMPVHANEQDKDILRIDSITRNNAKISVGESVSIRRIMSSDAELVAVSPLNTIPPGSEQYIRDCLENRAVMKGDRIVLPYFEEKLEYKIIRLKPSPVAVVTTSTKFFILV